MTDPSAGAPPAGRLLFVCTGNICRSAAAERLARRDLAELLGDAAHRVLVHSAGTRAVVGAPVHPHSAAVVRRLGGDVEGYAARRLTRPLVAEADLVLTMTREHRGLVLGVDPRALSRTFTLAEAAELVGLLGDTPAPDQPLARRLAAARTRRRSDEADDVPDPINGSPEVHEDVVHAIERHLHPVLRAWAADLGTRLHPAG